jgi:Family of unknown function (DUF6090)
MINFFRKIRKQMADDNKPLKYMRYAIGEIVLVVIGILIALSINNWNENRKLDIIRNSNYQQLLEDLKTDKEYIDEIIVEFTANDSLYDEYLKSYKTPNLTMDDVIDNLGYDKVDYTITSLRFQNSTINSLESTGEIKLIPSGLRKKLTELKRDLDYAVKTNSKGNEYYFDRIELAGTLGTGTGLQRRIKNQPFLRKELGIEKNLAQIIWSTEIGLVYKSFNERTTVKKLEYLRTDIKEIMELINIELNK